MDNNEFNNINEPSVGTLNGTGQQSTLNGGEQYSTLNGAQPVVTTTTLGGAVPDIAEPEKHENVLFGTVGAFLFALVGAAIYFVIYQIGFITGFAGLVTVVLSIFGYQLFSGAKFSKKGIIIAIIISILMIPLAEYACLSYEIFDLYKAEYDITIFDAARVAPQFLFDPEVEVLGPFVWDIVIAYALSGVAAFSYIKTALKSTKK